MFFCFVFYSFIHGIVRRISQIAQATQQQQQAIPLAPALVETYSRLLVYNEIELLGIKGFISKFIPSQLNIVERIFIGHVA